MTGQALLLAVAAVAVTACGSVGDGRDQGGPGLPVQLAGERYPGPPVEVDGTLVLSEGGCHLLDLDGARHMVVWPSGWELGGATVVPPDDRELAAGDRVTGSGRTLPIDGFPGGPDGYWASVLGFCDTGTDVLVLDTARGAP
jgi:hypothetical protein